MQFEIFSPTGTWKAAADLLWGPQQSVFDILRRPRVQQGDGTSQLLPKLWLAKVRIRRLEVDLPPHDGEPCTLLLEAKGQARDNTTMCVLHFPGLKGEGWGGKSPLPVIATSMTLELPFRIDGAGRVYWPTWIEKAQRVVGEGGRLSKHGHISPKELFIDIFGLEAPTGGEGLLLDVDGMALRGNRLVPWWDPGWESQRNEQEADGQKRLDLFRFEVDRRSEDGPQYTLAVERNPAWAESLRRCQSAAIQATAARWDEDGLPEASSPSVGLAPAPIPESIRWRYDGGQWVFRLKQALFDLELRGVAGSVARWTPDSLEISTEGGEMRMHCASPPGAAPIDGISYRYSSAENTWSGAFDVVLDPNDLAYALAQSRPAPALLSGESPDVGEESAPEPGPWSPEGEGWILTETGALRLPFPGEAAPASLAAPTQRLLQGMFSLGEVPWSPSESEESPLVPDLEKGLRGSLLVIDAEAASLTLVLEEHPSEGGGLTCHSIDLHLQAPYLRLEDLVPFYVPPERARAPDWSGPPPLPEPGDELLPFVGVSLVHYPDLPTADSAIGWKTEFEFKPGREQGAGHLLVEGVWLKNSLLLDIPPSLAGKTVYWFRPASLRWFPALPLYADPRNDPDRRLCAERTYLPLRPFAEEDRAEMTLRFGGRWQTLAMQFGRFTNPRILDADAALFSWITPDLPGMHFRLRGDAITIEEGRPASGPVGWLVRHEVPTLDELTALRTLPKKPDQGDGQEQALPSPRLFDAAWWAELNRLASLTRSLRDKLFEATLNFAPDEVLAAAETDVEVLHLYANTAYAGKASLSTIDPHAAVWLARPEGDLIPLIRDEHRLEGPSAAFRVDDVAENAIPTLSPVAEGQGEVRLKAGSLVPHVLAQEDGAPLVFDQSGRVSFQLGDAPEQGRMVRVPLADPSDEDDDSKAAITAFLWSHDGLALSPDHTDLSLYFAGLPVTRDPDGGQWRFTMDSLGAEDAILRDFRWGTVGPVDLWGLPFQVMELREVAFAEDAEAIPRTPQRIVLSGVLHFKGRQNDAGAARFDAAVRLADPATQEVVLALVREDAGPWQIESIAGHFVWPLFNATPDLADAIREELADPLPWIEGAVGLEAGRLLLHDASVVFYFLDRVWALPVELAEVADQPDLPFTVPLPEEPILVWDVEPSPDPGDPSEVRIEAVDGKVYLCRRTPYPASTIQFEVRASPDGAPERTLFDLDLVLAIGFDETAKSRTTSTVQLVTARLLAFDDWETPQALVQAGPDDAVDISSQQISLVANRKAGFRAGEAPFNFLPGWRVPGGEDAAHIALQAYLNAQVAPPSGEWRVGAAPIRRLQLLIESTLVTPDPLSFLLTYIAESGQPARLALRLTGQLHASNNLSWAAAGEQAVRLTHDVGFTLRQAELSQDHLTGEAAPHSFFRLRYREADEDPSGLAGMVELHCLATHRISHNGGSGQEVLHWTVPQRLYLGSPESFTETILLRDHETGKLHPLKMPLPGGQSGRINYRSIATIENGFVGPLGEKLAQVLKDQSAQTMVLEATEAFWVRPAQGSPDQRPLVGLWKEERTNLQGTPTAVTDFYDESDEENLRWLRLAMPFVTDTGGLIGSAAQADPELATLLQSVLPATGKRRGPPGKRPTPRPPLLEREWLDRYSLRNRPRHPGYGAPFDQVVLQPEAYDRLLPYTQHLPDFAPGWLVFRERDSFTPVKSGQPFGITTEVLDELAAFDAAAPAPTTLFAATEVIPAARSAERAWERIRDDTGRPLPYLLCSPLTGVEQVAQPVLPAAFSDDEEDQASSALTDWYLDWRGLYSSDHLAKMPLELKNLVLEWVNTLSAQEMSARFRDAPGGYSEDAWGYGLGLMVAERIVAVRQTRGDFTTIESLLDVKGLGIDKLNDIIYKAARTLYPPSGPSALEVKGQEICILVEIWLPAAQGWRSGGEGMALAVRGVFHLGVGPDDDWQTVLFSERAIVERPSENLSLRDRIRLWVRQKVASLASQGPSLLRATLLTPVEIDALPPRVYFLLPIPSKDQSPASTRRERLGLAEPLRTDPRFDPLEAGQPHDPLALGPDYLGGEVYYVPSDWIAPPPPVLEDIPPGAAIEDFTAEPAVVNPGETATLEWTLFTEEDLTVIVEEGGDSGTTHHVTGQKSLVVRPTQTTIYTLKVNQDGAALDYREVAVRVRVRASGSAVGLAYKLAGAAPGPRHPSRLPWSGGNGQFHRWIEVVRDLMYRDLTRRDAASRYEPGWLLPASRPITWASASDRLGLAPFLPTRAVQFFTSGRPGSLMRIRTALLNEDRAGMLRRTASMAHEIRHPRPVPLPVELWPFDPDAGPSTPGLPPRPTCRVERLDADEAGPPPFDYTRLEWQDPLFNRRLLAAGQEVSAQGFALALDRSLYAGVDVMYPEIRLDAGITGTIEVSISVQRTVNFKSQTLHTISYSISSAADVGQKAPVETLPGRQDPPARWVWEIGLNQPAVLAPEPPKRGDANLDLVLENYDEIHVQATLNGVRQGWGAIYIPLHLVGVVRTDMEVWPQPQNAYGILRTERQPTSSDGQTAETTDLAAFGWLPKPLIVKRGDRFAPDSWAGTFRYTDAALPRPEAYLLTISLWPDGGQLSPSLARAEVLDAVEKLDDGIVPEWVEAAFAGFPDLVLSGDVQVEKEEEGLAWVLDDPAQDLKARLRRIGTRLEVYALSTVGYEVLSFTPYGEQAVRTMGKGESK